MSSTATLPEAAPAGGRTPFRIAVALLVVVPIVILKGAMTTSTGSGLAFADWPLSDGQLMPERSLTTVPGFLEHFHRMFAGLAILLSLWLAIVLQRGATAPSSTTLLRRTAWFGFALIVVQAVLGGLGVWFKLPPITSVLHGMLAQWTLATFAWVAYQLSDLHARTVPILTAAPGAGRKLAVSAVVLLVVQTIVGGIARHTNSPHALWTHVGNAFVVFLVVVIATGFAMGRLAAAPGLKAIVRWLTTLLLVQIVLGFIALLIRNSAGKTPENVANLGTAALISVHVLLGALLTVFATVMAAQVFRATRRPLGPAPGSEAGAGAAPEVASA